MHLSLDEYYEADLECELGRRHKLQQRGLCDYCERPYDTKACKFPGRHSGLNAMLKGYHLECDEAPLTNPCGEITLETPTVESIVHGALDNALENGYNMANWTLYDIAADLVCFEANLENHAMSSLLPHIISWRAKNNMNGERI